MARQTINALSYGCIVAEEFSLAEVMSVNHLMIIQSRHINTVTVLIELLPAN